jgi:fused signal recognition particle receptor
MGWFDKLKDGLSKTRKGIVDKLDQVLVGFGKVDEELFLELEEILVSADVGVNTTLAIIDGVRKKVKEDRVVVPQEIKRILKDQIKDILGEEQSVQRLDTIPSIVLVVGVNGVGKTTTIGKLAQKYKDTGKKVTIAAADTFRAAAIEQVEIWAKRAEAEVIRHGEGADPAAVVFDAIAASKARKIDVLICDTAGRLHTKKNLMEELKKIGRIIDKELPTASKEVLLVLDATTGQNAIAQAKIFKEAVNPTGIVLTKLDGTAKGGIVVAIRAELGIPILYIGVGEKAEDLQEFDSKAFVDALFGE